MGLLERLFGSSSEISLTTSFDEQGNVTSEKVSYRGLRMNPKSEEVSLSCLRSINKVAINSLYGANNYNGSKM